MVQRRPAVASDHQPDCRHAVKWITRERPKTGRIACPDDHQMLQHGLVLYDALYAWCRSAQGETHSWPPTMV